MSKDNQIKLLKKARSKYFSRALSLGLINYNKNSFLQKRYWETYRCSDKHTYDEENGKLVTQYCKKRWCQVCNRIRTAHLLNGYLNQILELKERQFVTLTAPTCLSGYLRHRIKEFEDEWRRILENNRMKSKRKKSKYTFDTFRGIRKMECTIRPQNYYHYHYHIIIEGKAQAEWLVSQWLKRFKNAKNVAQDIRPANERSVKELFKYFTKLLAKDIGLFNQNDKRHYIGEFKHLDFVFRTIQGKRIYQPFGGLKKASEDITDDLIKATERPKGLAGKIWKWVDKDWVSEFGELLTGYEPSQSVKEVLHKCPKQINNE